MSEPLPVHPIGYIHTTYHDRLLTPVHAALNPADEGYVVLEDPYRSGLLELDTFDFAWLLTWLSPRSDDPNPVAMTQQPFLLTSNPRPIGLFAMRGPRRPNPIGLHLVKVLAVGHDGFRFAGVDMIDNTPVLDIKPYAAPLDLPHGNGLQNPIRSGWFDSVDLSGPHTPAALFACNDGPSEQSERSTTPPR